MRDNALRTIRLTTLLAAAAILAPATAVSIQNKASGPPNASAQSTSQMVRLWVLATSRGRKLVLDLNAADFRVFDDDRQQRITYFSRRSGEPLALGLLIDTSRSRLYEPDPESWQTYSQWLHRLLRPGDRAFVATFAEKAALLSPPTEDLGQLDNDLKLAFSASPAGTTGLYDAIYTLSEERFAGETGRKALLVVSDSGDNYSFHKQLQTLERVQRAGLTVYALLPWVDRAGQPPFAATQSAQFFSSQTGGLFFLAFSRKALERDLDGIRIALAYTYTLAYAPSGVPAYGGYHAIRVKCRRPGVELYVSPGYYASSGEWVK
jgi:VWFA-related protein